MAPADGEMITVIKVFFSVESWGRGEGRTQGGLRPDQFVLISDVCVGVCIFYTLSRTEDVYVQRFDCCVMMPCVQPGLKNLL